MKDIVVAGVKEARMLSAIDNQKNWASNTSDHQLQRALDTANELAKDLN
ncbi:hypothetical protein [Paenibacillus sp. 453mf]|nr:hypothetical protein [Paenibacillus sp. 453mf]